MVLAFLRDSQTETVRIVCILSGFVGERGVVHLDLFATPTAKAEMEHKQHKQEKRNLLETLKQMAV